MLAEYLFSNGIGIALFIMALVLGKRPKAKSDYILLVWLLVFVVNFLAFLILHKRQSDFETWQLVVLEFTEASIFFHGPFLLFYSSSLIRISYTFNYKILLHLFPFLVCFLALLTTVIQGEIFNTTIRNILLTAKMISLILYVTIVLRNLYKHKGSVEDVFSNTHRKHLTWLLVISWGVLAIWSIAVLSVVLERLIGFRIPQYEGLFTNSALSIFMFIISYFGVRQPALFHEFPQKNSQEGIMLDPKQTLKYQKSRLSYEDCLSLHKTLISYLQAEKPFLNPELTSYSLAQQLEMQTNHLSQVINSVEKKSFFYFINTYRVEHVKKVLENGEKKHLTLSGIAYEAGFNSRTSFNRTFKKIVGETPSQYRNRFKILS